MTYSVRCRHGELFAVCRECPDPLYVADDEEPFTSGPRRNPSSGFAAGCAVLLLVAAVAGLAGYLLGVTR
jgi:hypothetical protein